jgi:hypothetical protein
MALPEANIWAFFTSSAKGAAFAVDSIVAKSDLPLREADCTARIMACSNPGKAGYYLLIAMMFHFCHSYFFLLEKSAWI